MAEKKVAKTAVKTQDSPTQTPADKLMTLRKELSDARRSLAANELPNPRVITKARRDIARLLTEINVQRKKEKTNA